MCVCTVFNVCICVNMHIHLNMHIYVHLSIWMCVCVYTSVYACTCVKMVGVSHGFLYIKEEASQVEDRVSQRQCFKQSWEEV